MSILSHRYKYHLVCQGFFKFNPKTNFLKSQALLTWNLKLQANFGRSQTLQTNHNQIELLWMR